MSDWHQTQEQFYGKGSHSALRYSKTSVYARTLATRAAQAVSLSKSDRVLEVGAGAGRFSPHLAALAGSYTAMDASAHLMSLSGPTDGPPIEKRVGDVYELPQLFAEASFDVVFGFFFLHHLEDLPRCFESIRRVLKPGGRVLFLEPNRLNPLYYLQTTFCSDFNWAAEKGFLKLNPGAIVKQWTEKGYENASRENFGFFPPPVLEWSRIALPIQERLERIAILKPWLPFVLLSARRR